MKENFIKIQKSARYFTLGEINESVKHVWFVLHGYGQLAKYFIRNFNSLESPKRLIVAPEGFHKFYLEGTGGRVGSNWMTKENRLRDIDDYCSYLNQLDSTLRKQFKHTVKVHIFGFSQGVSTAFRWVNTYQGSDLVSLNGWAGTFPPDIDYRIAKERLNRISIRLNFGNNDEYISIENAKEMQQKLRDLGVCFKARYYQGEHKIYLSELTELFNKAERA